MTPDHLFARARFLLPMAGEEGTATRIADGYVLTASGTVQEVGAYSFKIGERILRNVGHSLKVLGGKSSEDGPLATEDLVQLNGVILPGFIKAHGHDHESPLIGIAKDVPLTTWLDNAVNLFTGFLNERADDLSERFGRSPHLVTYLKARVDDISYGITSCMVHHCNFNKYHVAEIVEANRSAGTRMIIAVGSQDRHYDERILDTPEEAVERLDSALKLVKDSPRTTIVPGPDQFFSNGPELLKALKDWARRNGTFLHIHSSEEPGTTKWFRDTYGMTPVEYADSIGVLDADTILAHQVNCTDNDLKLLKDRSAKVVHNPLANTILGSGMPPLIRMLDMGIPVAVSTDGSGSADNQNIIIAAKLASQFQKAFNKDASLLPAQRCLELITIEPAKVLGLNAGRLEPGRDADLVVLSLERPNLIPTRRDNVMENIIWAADGSEARYVVSGGQVLLEDGQFKTLDAGRILRDVQVLSELFSDWVDRERPQIKGTGVHT